MKVTLYMATTIDGFVARRDGDSDWVSELDTAGFEGQIEKKGCIILGSKTYNQFLGELYPVGGVTNIILSKSGTNTEQSNKDVFGADSPEVALRIAEEKGFENVLLIGGGKVNGAFFAKNLIDEVCVVIHPLAFGSGIKLFEEVEGNLSLEKKSVIEMDGGLIKVWYAVRGN